jgi:hypothetical protein
VRWPTGRGGVSALRKRGQIKERPGVRLDAWVLFSHGLEVYCLWFIVYRLLFYGHG